MYIFRKYFIISFIACFILGDLALANSNEKRIVSDIAMPKYFFADQINKTCKMKKVSNDFYSNSLYSDFDLRKKNNYSWLAKLEDYNWKEDHDKRSNSLDVFFHQLTDRMEYLHATLINSIIDGNIEVQAEKAIELMVSWAKADFILDSTTISQIKDMIKAGSFSSCYQGKGDEGAECHWHTAQEAARYAGQFVINANLVKPYMDKNELAIIEKYLVTIYKKYIHPWYFLTGAGVKNIKYGFYQMGHGAISVIAFAHWNSDKKLVNDTFKSTLRHIGALILQDGFIDNNSFIKICAGQKKEHLDNYDAGIELPTTLNEINSIVENTAAKKKYIKNSSIIIKSYLLNKNEKKLSKSDDFIILTEKEVQLLELFLNSSKPISKDNILSSVWNYSSEADTHTVETHIYRLRKKISDKFMDEKFILNSKDGYCL